MSQLDHLFHEYINSPSKREREREREREGERGELRHCLNRTKKQQYKFILFLTSAEDVIVNETNLIICSVGMCVCCERA